MRRFASSRCKLLSATGGGTAFIAGAAQWLHGTRCALQERRGGNGDDSISYNDPPAQRASSSVGGNSNTAEGGAMLRMKGLLRSSHDAGHTYRMLNCAIANGEVERSGVLARKLASMMAAAKPLPPSVNASSSIKDEFPVLDPDQLTDKLAEGIAMSMTSASGEAGPGVPLHHASFDPPLGSSTTSTSSGGSSLRVMILDAVFEEELYEGDHDGEGGGTIGAVDVLTEYLQTDKAQWSSHKQRIAAVILRVAAELGIGVKEWHRASVSSTDASSSSPSSLCNMAVRCTVPPLPRGIWKLLSTEELSSSSPPHEDEDSDDRAAKYIAEQLKLLRRSRQASSKESKWSPMKECVAAYEVHLQSSTAVYSVGLHDSLCRAITTSSSSSTSATSMSDGDGDGGGRSPSSRFVDALVRELNADSVLRRPVVPLTYMLRMRLAQEGRA